MRHRVLNSREHSFIRMKSLLHVAKMRMAQHSTNILYTSLKFLGCFEDAKSIVAKIHWSSNDVFLLALCQYSFRLGQLSLTYFDGFVDEDSYSFTNECSASMNTLSIV